MGLLLPCTLLTLTRMAFTAVAAVLWDTVRPLQSRLGATMWCLAWLLVAIGGQDGGRAARRAERRLAQFLQDEMGAVGAVALTAETARHR